MSVARPHRRFSTVENRVTSIPRQHMSVRPETQGKHSACVVAPSLPHTLADCAPPRPQPHRRFSTVENRPHRPPAPTCVCKHLSDRIPEVAKLHRSIAPPHARRLCLAAGTVPSPFLDSRKSVASTARANVCVCKHLSDRIPRGRKTASRRRAIAPPHARRLCLAAGTVPSPFLDSRKSAASTARANVCVQAS
jgi:hypothetical protein